MHIILNLHNSQAPSSHKGKFCDSTLTNNGACSLGGLWSFAKIRSIQ